MDGQDESKTDVIFSLGVSRSVWFLSIHSRLHEKELLSSFSLAVCSLLCSEYLLRFGGLYVAS